ncbi:hypothetical protein EUTSA_v10009801mg [Eutrema salsugineum]|uniref:F-box domain-containing protein n=1 Tax=Eutrema salsugineum TaxID=72664 RepID=V4K6Z3_EUTSA|nr:hypothetical protein EUTSA_v10009801mg [Eutrema salsugineum]
MVRRDTPKSWSDLPPDLLNSVFKRLSFTNFQRAKSVYSSWHSASKQCLPKNNQILPWLIIFPKTTITSTSFCIATYGSWLLIRNPLHNLYILNLFTNERY